MPRSYSLNPPSQENPPNETPILPAFPCTPAPQTVSTSPGQSSLFDTSDQSLTWPNPPLPSPTLVPSGPTSLLTKSTSARNFADEPHDCALNQATGSSDCFRCPVCCRSISSTSGSSYTSASSNSIRKRNMSLAQSDSEHLAEINLQSGANYSSNDHQIRINRDPISLATLERAHQPVKQPYHSPRRTFHRLLPEKFSFGSTICSLFPVLKWLPAYDLKADLTSDIIAGVTVLALQIPQGLAYSKLAGVAAIYGLYATFFSVAVYCFMGTSRHMSMGLYAITSMMSRNTIQNYTGPSATGIEILITLCFMIGILQFVFGLLRLGNLSLLFSDNFLSAFTVGCSVLIFNSQLSAALGISYASDENASLGIPSDCINTWISTFRHIGESNKATLVMSACVIFSLVLCKYYLEPYVLVKRYGFQFPIPIDLFVVIITTIISMVVDLNLEYGVDIVGEIPSGFAAPAVPRMDLISSLFMDAIIQTVVASVCQVSLVKMAAKKYGYPVSLNQEFLAYGTCNIFCSFFYCFPTCGSLARTNVNENAGARSQLSAMITSVLLVLFLLFFTSYLGPLPKSALSGIIIVAMIPSYVKVRDIVQIARVSKFDAVLWVLTAITVTIFGVNIGILVGLVTSIAIILIRVALPTSTIKYPIAESEVYLSPEVYQGLNERSLEDYRVAVFNFQGPLTFLSAAAFKSDIRSKLLDSIASERAKIELDANNNRARLGRYNSRVGSLFDITIVADPKPDNGEHKEEPSEEHKPHLHKNHYLHHREEPEGVHIGIPHHPAEIVLSESISMQNSALEARRRSTKYRMSMMPPPRPNQTIVTLIMDMTQVIYIDMTGIEMLIDLKDDLEEMNVQLLLACCSVSVLSTLERGKFFRDIVGKENCFLTVHDAVVAAKHLTTFCTTEVTDDQSASKVKVKKASKANIHENGEMIGECNGISL